MQKSRNSLESLYGIPASSIERWEKGSAPSLKSCLNLVAAAKSENIDCSIDWLLDNGGYEPKFIASDAAPMYIQNIYKRIIKKNYHCFLHKIDNDSMAPQFKLGNWVIAQKVSVKGFSSLIDKICLVDIPEGRFLRLIKPCGYDAYDLITMNYVSGCPNFYDKKLISVATIICQFHK